MYKFKKYFKKIRLLIKLFTFPFYIVCYLQIHAFISLYRILSANFTDYQVKRKDRYYAGFSFLLVAIYLLMYSNIIDLLYKYGVFGELSIYVDKIYLYFSNYKYIILKIFLLIFVFSLFEEVFFKQIDDIEDMGPGKQTKERLRKKALKKDMIYAGTKFSDTKKFMEKDTVFVTDEMRSLNVEAVGTTGTGKSQSWIFPWAFQDIKRGKGCIIIDAKGDISFFKKLYAYHKKYNSNNSQDIKFVNLGDSSFTNTYNPIFRGNAIELKDRIMGAFEWGEGEAKYYKDSAENSLMIILQSLEALGYIVTFHDLHTLFVNKEALSELKHLLEQKSDNNFLINQLEDLLNDFNDLQKKCSGLINNLNIIAHGGVSKIVNIYKPDIDLLDVYKNKHIVYFTLPSNLLGETARAFGRMLLMDIKSLTGYIERGEADKKFFPVFIDEFAEFATKEFVGWLNKTRSSGIAIHLAHQSLGDLEQIDKAFVKQVIDNTNMKIIFRVNDPDTAETFANYLGTYTTVKETVRINKSLLADFEGEVGSEREVEEYEVNPNVFKKALKRGQAVFSAKHPSNLLYLINTDYLEDIDFKGDIELNYCDNDSGKKPFKVDERLIERKERHKKAILSEEKNEKISKNNMLHDSKENSVDEVETVSFDDI